MYFKEYKCKLPYWKNVSDLKVIIKVVLSGTFYAF